MATRKVLENIFDEVWPPEGGKEHEENKRESKMCLIPTLCPLMKIKSFLTREREENGILCRAHNMKPNEKLGPTLFYGHVFTSSTTVTTKKNFEKQ